MKGITLSTISNNKQLHISVDPLLFEGVMKPEPLKEYIGQSEFNGFFLLTNAIEILCERVNAAKAEDMMDAIEGTIGEIRDADILIKIADDQMSASIKIEAPHSGAIPSVQSCVKLLHQQGVKRGVSTKRIAALMKQASEASPGTEFTEQVAKGLPPRTGKPSFVKPLVPNALDRVLKPKLNNEGKADMRNLGEISCVQANQSVARNMPPSNGRQGYTVTGAPLKAEAGDWKEVKLGKNTEVSKKDKNLIIASITGQPKFEDGKMTVDDTFESKGVNVGTGNIEYDGAVIVNGDVKESMVVVAKGDITINGFVESATLRAGGDIIITEGAMGKMHEEDCKLYANGSIFVTHGQGLDIVAGKHVNIQKQLAYSRIKCKGKVTVGDIKNPMGTVFASDIKCYSTVRAGSVGAVSGSSLTIDFSEGINLLTDRHEVLLKHLKLIRGNNFDHEVKLRDIHKQAIPESLKRQLDRADVVFDSEKKLLDWLEKMNIEMEKAKVTYEEDAKIIANKELFQGVIVKMNKRNWRSEREYPKCCVKLVDGKWEYDPLT